MKPGDKVKLKSGGPVMTIDRIYNSDNGPRAACDWFEGTKPMHGNYALSSLEIVP